jgi:hypothetical protein
MVAGHLHAAIQPEASALGTSFWRRYILTEIYPAITTKVEFEELKNRIAIPSEIPFTAIYVAGDFVMVGTAQAGTSVGEWTSGKANYEK